MSNTQKAINSTVKYRNLPNILKGDKCEVDGKMGVIWGGNSSCNFNVKFDSGEVFNCHPSFKMKIWDSRGVLIHESGE